ncbi:DedA family protein [Clostridium sardiniense]|uniref:DedA family protein n=1 Tax=Clostridium sardiniense TaxID=29369 RepID=UPI00195E4D66|nr:DedA family protein [Clostridium sardiniense]MBM7835327.1 membrane protein DedA with SNARE-associated domain [Clostridium sardiniense]
MDFMNHVIAIATHITENFGYLGIFIATMLEYACIPLPSEIVLPAVGLSIANGRYSFILVLICTICAAIVGALISYAVGYFGGEIVIRWLKRKIPSSRKGIEMIENLFSNYGKSAVFFTRVVPFTRTYVSLLAGAERLNKPIFIVFSAIGIGIWNFVLLLIGFYIGNNTELIGSIFRKYSTICILIVIVGIVIFIYRKRKRKNS